MLSDLFAKWSEQTPAPLKSGATRATWATDDEKPQTPAGHSGSRPVAQTENTRATRATGVAQVAQDEPERATGAKTKSAKEPAADREWLPKLPKLPTKTKQQDSAPENGDQGWDAETAALIAWFLKTEPPAHPFKLQQAVTIAHPDNYWEYLRQDIAAGPGRARGKTGAFQENLRQVYRVLHDGKDIGGGTT